MRVIAIRDSIADGKCQPAVMLQIRSILLHMVLICAAGTGAQEEALLLLKASLDPTATALPSWDTTTSPCQWQGITCNPAGQVTNMCAFSTPPHPATNSAVRWRPLSCP